MKAAAPALGYAPVTVRTKGVGSLIDDESGVGRLRTTPLLL